MPTAPDVAAVPLAEPCTTESEIVAIAPVAAALDNSKPAIGAADIGWNPSIISA
jgi:hypothetical protein